MKKILVSQRFETSPTESDIARLEELLGAKLPSDYKNFIQHERPFSVDDEQGEALLFTVDGYRELVLNYFLGFDAGSYNIFDDLEAYKGRIPLQCLPIADDPAGNLFIIHLPTGEIYFWDHENEPASDLDIKNSRNVGKVAKDFSEFIGLK